MMVSCPACYCKAKTVDRKRESKKKSLLTCQCTNINCSATFKFSLSMIGGYSRKPKVVA